MILQVNFAEIFDWDWA